MDLNSTFLAHLDRYTWLDLTVTKWLTLLALTGVLWPLYRFVIRKAIARFQSVAKRTVTHWDDMAAALLQQTSGVLIFVLAFYTAAVLVGTPEATRAIFYKVLVVAIFFQVAIWGRQVVEYLLRRYLMKRNHLAEDATVDISAYSAMSMTAKFLLWTFLFLLLLDNLGVNITALVTGLGIGGIAIALALQNILGDMFASLSIVLDRPFEIGDFIVVGDKMGTVENIGLKTSRIKSLSGEQLVFPNKTLIEKEISNFKTMQTRRALFTFGLSYGTTLEQLRLVPQLVKEIIEAQKDTKFDRAHFVKYGESSLDFEAVYIMQVADYNIYMDTQQEINLQIFAQFKERGIEFAFPTRTVTMQEDKKIPMRQPRQEIPSPQPN